jgi:hypothetical protein
MEYQRHRLDGRVSSVLGRLSTRPAPGPEVAQDLMDRLSQFVPHVGPSPRGPELERALAPVQWLLDRATARDLPLTQAGYLKPADVQELAGLLPSMDDWIFGVHREVDVQPVLTFRLWLMRHGGLLRKYKGALIPTTKAKPLVDDPEALWLHLARHLIPTEPDFEVDAMVVALIHLAADPVHTKRHLVAEALTALGWSFRGGLPITASDVYAELNTAWALLDNVGRAKRDGRLNRTLSDPARCLLRDALVEYSVVE